jgi:hypothetical protein
VALLAAIVLLAPLGWGMVQYGASGHFSLGTSLDGINLRKGNNAMFLARYPPQPGIDLDIYDTELNRGVSFRDEWSFDAYHRTLAKEYIKTHPADTFRGSLVKASVYFLSITKYGTESRHGLIGRIEQAGMLLFRLLFWVALAVALYSALSGNGVGRKQGIVYLVLVASCALPYLVGFAYMRHVLVLIYPTVLFFCTFFCATAVRRVPQHG